MEGDPLGEQDGGGGQGGGEGRDGVGVEGEDEGDGEICKLLDQEASENEDGGGTSDVEGDQDH